MSELGGRFGRSQEQSSKVNLPKGESPGERPRGGIVPITHLDSRSSKLDQQREIDRRAASDAAVSGLSDVKFGESTLAKVIETGIEVADVTLTIAT